MFGIGNVIKAVVYLVIVLLIAGGLWYVTNLKAALAISEQNNQKLEDGIKQQQQLLENMQKDIAQIQETNKQLQAENARQKADVENLANKFQKNDLGVLATTKPVLVEKLVNRGTVNVLRCLEIASGSPLNEKEKNAKTPQEANRECPGLIDPNYTPVN
jgi:predicted nuclease with TOPRIM domain